MMRSPAGALAALRDAIRRHGGGWRGARSVLSRSLKVFRALGWRGLWRRVHAARHREAGAHETGGVIDFPPAAPIDRVRLSVGVMVHLYYPDLLDELAQALANLPLPCTLMVSVVDEPARAAALQRLTGLPCVQALHVRVVPNRGRDIAPMLLTFGKEILALDLLCHVHTKKSLYAGQEQTEWRRYLVESLLGSAVRVAWILGMFQADPHLGLVYPESFRMVPLWGHTWLSNADWGRQLGPLLGVTVDTASYFDYPAGSMFWARTAALRPLFELGLSLESFPPEQGQTDGTLQHALERLLGLVVPAQGLRVGILPADGRQALLAEGERNWRTYFESSMPARIAYGAVEARLVSFDLFDTLLVRPFLEASGARDYLAYLAHKRLGVENFAALRADAETRARVRAGRDASLAEIYRALSDCADVTPPLAAELCELELSLEQRLLRPRQAVLDALQSLARDGRRRLVGISDMYLATAELQRVLPASVTAALAHLHVSCETGWRKDTEAAWRQLPRIEQVEPPQWLHVGDNEHADVQLPQALGFIHPVHVLRPVSLLTVVPALRGLRPNPAQRGRWQDQLWLGLVANHFAELGDRHPEALLESRLLDEPESFGYAVLGPLVVDYLAWLARLALQRGTRTLLFLSREGFLLQRIYTLLRAAVPQLAAVAGHYLLASRRGVNTPALERMDDLAGVFASPFTGSLHALLEARLGTAIADEAARVLGAAAMQQEVYLPEMAGALVERLAPAADTMLGIAARERDAYLAYWAERVEAADRPIVADIGYAGSIQARLQRLTGQSLGGAYFAVKADVDQVGADGGWASARFHDERLPELPITPVMQHHLLLESVLTSPDGQFSHFEATPAGPRPAYRAERVDGARQAVLERIHAGVERFAMDVCSVAGADALELSFDNELVQVPLREVGTGRWPLGDWAARLAVEDRYTGRGDVAIRPEPA